MTANTYATEDYADDAAAAAAAALVDAAPGTLDTLNELAAALGDDAAFSTTVTNALALKAPLASPAFTGTPTGITKTHVGLGNVDNTADASKTFAGEAITSGTIADARIASTLARDSEVASAVAAEATARDTAIGVHSADTTSVHGITDTSALETTSGSQAKVDTHVNDTSAAHAASAISASSATLVGTGTDVQAVLEELDNAIVADETALANHLSDSSAAHAASAVAFTPNGSIAATDVQTAIQEVRDEAAGGGAPSTADYLVGTADGGLSNEIVVGATPGGELGGTWASPTVDATHSGSTHAAVQAAAEATAANADNLTSGTVADARIASTLARDSEVTSAVAAEAVLARNADNLTSGTVAIARLPLDADLASLSLPASTTISAFGATVIDDADASAARTTLGLAIGTNVQAFDADLSTYAGITPGALGQAILPMTTLTDKGLLLGRGAAAPAALAPDAASSRFLKNSVASGDPTWQLIAESDVTNLTTDLSAVQTQTALQAAQMECTRLAELGQYVSSGLALSPNATPTKLNMAVGVVFMATTEIKVAAQTAITPGAGASKDTIVELADGTNPKWVVVELDSASVVQYNEGTAAAAPAFPTITASRTPLGFLYIPANATNVDTLLTTNNGLAKLIDARVVKSIHPTRKFASILTRKAQTNPTTLQRIIDTNAITIPDLSVSVGDVYMYDMALAYYNPTTARTLRLVFSAFGSTIFDYTSPSLTADANIRMGYIRGSIQIQANTSLNTLCDIVITAPSADYMTPPATNAAAVRVAGAVTVGTLATATGLTFELTAMISGSDAACIVATNLVNFYKQPV